MRILIADDDEFVRGIIRHIVVNLGHEPVECASGTEVLGYVFRGDLPQLVLLDWLMPGMTGLDVCRKIHERVDLSYTYILMVSSKDAREDVVAGLRAGVDDYIAKPFDPQELMTRIRAGIRMVDLNNSVAAQRVRMIASGKMATLGEMAGGIAHEINNPLAIIQAHADRMDANLEANTVDPEDMRASCRSIISTVQRIARTISALRSFASEGESEAISRFSVRQLVDDTLGLCRTKFEASGIRVEVGALSSELEIQGQRRQLCQALYNLVDNAAWAASGARERWLRLDATEDPLSIMISVTDSGVGILPENREKIMRPFFTTRPVGKASGLGLSIAKGIVSAHRGTLHLDTASAHTRFVMSLPKHME